MPTLLRWLLHLGTAAALVAIVYLILDLRAPAPSAQGIPASGATPVYICRSSTGCPAWDVTNGRPILLHPGTLLEKHGRFINGDKWFPPYHRGENYGWVKFFPPPNEPKRSKR